MRPLTTERIPLAHANRACLASASGYRPESLGFPPATATSSLHRQDDCFAAFVELHEDRYLRYAWIRLLDETACRLVVHFTLGNLARCWPSLLRSPRPLAAAWAELHLQTDHIETAGEFRNDALQPLYSLMPGQTADAVVLRCRLGMSEEDAADLMGVDRSVVAVSMLAASRQLSGRLP